MFGPEDMPRLSAPAAAEIDAFQRTWDGVDAYAIATVVHTAGATAAKAGARAIVKSDGEVIGFVGGGCLRGALRKAAADAIDAGEPRLIHVRPNGETLERGSEEEELAALGAAYPNNCPSRGRISVFIEPVASQPSMIVYGAGELAHWVREFGAAVGLHAQFANDAPPTASSSQLQNGFIVVATQGQGDKAALEAALATTCPNLFFVASPKKAAHWREKLRDSGVSEEALARLRAPAGLDLGAKQPAEIAVTIIAEIIQLRRRGEPTPELREGTHA